MAARWRVVVKFREGLAIPYADGVQDWLRENAGDELEALSSLLSRVRLDRMIRSVEGKSLDELLNAAFPRRPPGDAPLKRFFGTLHDTREEALAVAAAFRKSKLVETAYVESGASERPPNPRVAAQGYRRPARHGIDADFAATVPGGTGAGERMIDIEQGWHPAHEDFANATRPSPALVSGQSQAWLEHGTRVLGVILMRDNGTGGLGIVHDVTAELVSEWRAADSWNRVEAIADAAVRLNAGDVLLIEGQAAATGGFPVFADSAIEEMSGLPVEYDDAVFEAILTATAKGIVVIEPAGNAGIELDRLLDRDRKAFLARSSGTLRDSGAVFVTGAESPPHHVRYRASNTNHGSRVDCFAWGSGVFTADDPALSDPYTNGFSLTSAAAAIVAGAAVSVQGMAVGAGLARFTPAAIRVVLCDPAVNTPPDPATIGAVGFMPNLRRIHGKYIATAAAPTPGT